MRIFILFIAIFFCLSAQCEIYKIIDKATGKITYTDVDPGKDASSSVEKLSVRPINSMGYSPSGYVSIDQQPFRKEQAALAAMGDISAEQAFASRSNNVQISGSGMVKKLLPQDNEGSRHQKFILQLASGQTLLVSHNIDLAPEIISLAVGDRVDFYGEYEWNKKGGVIHWTHHDPGGFHVDGWLRHGGRIYQ